ncbi:gamma-interferon-inducible protein 16 isoform X2 [Grammomys surdaster]|nr:gamma-interferon-inducible protein 16 isoform X2 [Grammomys surdaster]
MMKVWEVEPAMTTSSPKESKDTIPVSPDTMTTQFWEEEPNIPELSATSTYPDECEPLTPQEFPTTASSSLQTPLEPPEISSTILATSQASSAPCSTCDKASPVSPVTTSSITQITQPYQVTSTLSYSHQATLESPKADTSSVQTFHMTPATMTSGHNCPQAPAAAVSSRFNKPQVTPATLPSSVQAPWMPQATVSSSVHTLRMTPATMTTGCNIPRVSAATVSSNNPQVTPATVCSSVQTSRMTSAAMTSGCNSPQVSGSRVPVSYSNPRVTPATEPSSAQIFGMTSAAMTSGCNSPQVSAAAVSSSYNNAPQVSSVTVPRSFSAIPVSPATPLKKPRLKNVPKQPSEEDGYQQGSKQVMVLKATDPFTYDMRQDKRMFHATVATETEYFRVKVFDIALRKKFTPKKVIVISNYTGYNGFLEIYRASCVSEVNGDNVMNVPYSLIKRANATPKINTLCTPRGRTFVNGIFTVYMKTVKSEFIYYGIEDKTGRMEVVVYGQFANMYCEPGDKLQLVCFELSYSLDKWQLRSERHSYMQVIQARQRDHEPPNLHAVIETAQTPHAWIPEQQ